MKQEYNIKDKVWIHIGERKLTEGRVVEIIDLEHLGEGHSPNDELYIIELKTGIDDIYEVRSFAQISPDAQGPINLFRKVKEDVLKAKRYLKKVGVQLPIPEEGLAEYIQDEILTEDEDPNDPTPEQIHAAIERAEKAKKVAPLTGGIRKPIKKRPFTKRKKNDNINTNNT